MHCTGESERLRLEAEQLSNEVKAAQAEVRVMMLVLRMLLAMRMMLIMRMMLVLRIYMLSTDQS